MKKIYTVLITTLDRSYVAGVFHDRSEAEACANKAPYKNTDYGYGGTIEEWPLPER